MESLQSEQKMIKNSFSASDLYNKTRLDRSDSGIDRQSLLMDNSREHGSDSTTNIALQECSANSIKKIIEITSLIRVIEHHLNIANNYSDNDSVCELIAENFELFISLLYIEFQLNSESVAV